MRGVSIVSILIAFASMEVHARRYELATGELQEKAQALADLAVKEGMQGALQFCAFKDGKWIRIETTLVDDPRLEAQEAMLEQNPGLKNMYKAGDGNTAVFYLVNGEAHFCSFGAPEEVVKF